MSDPVKAYLQRTYKPLATIGVLTVIRSGNFYQYKTLERPWRNNERKVSCIPEGTYQCVADDTGRFQWWNILNVLDRDNIEIHEANYVRQLMGCISLGKEHGESDGIPCVWNSKQALQELVEALGGKPPLELSIYKEI